MTDDRRDGSLRLVGTRRVPPHALAYGDVIDGSTGALLASFRNLGHIEGVFPVDIGDDGIPEYCLSATDNPTGMGLLGIIRIPQVTAPLMPSLPDEVPLLVEPASLAVGLVASIRFPLDAYSTTRAHAREVTEEAANVLRICVVGTGDGPVGQRCVQYYVDFSDPRRPTLVSAQITDTYREIIRKAYPSVSQEDIEAEIKRLSSGVLFLTPRGWVPMEVRQP